MKEGRKKKNGACTSSAILKYLYFCLKASIPNKEQESIPNWDRCIRTIRNDPLPDFTGQRHTLIRSLQNNEN